MIEFTIPSLPLSCYDNVEMAGCIEDKERGFTERVDDDREPHFWSVYLHLKEGGCECIADFAEMRDAEAFDLFMSALVAVAV